ncbi:hypothetical protein F7725_008817 [Dissostichus mawsoni]|nr:hypothetical protein F7725_008817 [Dissostichus mawsoni]
MAHEVGYLPEGEDSYVEDSYVEDLPVENDSYVENSCVEDLPVENDSYVEDLPVENAVPSPAQSDPSISQGTCPLAEGGGVAENLEPIRLTDWTPQVGFSKSEHLAPPIGEQYGTNPGQPLVQK